MVLTGSGRLVASRSSAQEGCTQGCSCLAWPVVHSGPAGDRRHKLPTVLRCRLHAAASGAKTWGFLRRGRVLLGL